MSTVISQYINGNCVVTLGADGTKTREWDGVPRPEHPESIDLKITDFCDAACRYCHESSTVRGERADWLDVLDILKGLPPGVEIALGGGDPLSNPDLDTIIDICNEKGLIPNVTVNAKHLPKLTIRPSRIGGLGISYDAGSEALIEPHVHENTVVHFIAGIHLPETALHLKYPKILILGYKEFGRGKQHNQDAVQANLRQWRYWVNTVCRKTPVVSFDNLAVEQLDLRREFGDEVFTKFYMGDDGKFTMYIDAVKMEYAVSSTSPRKTLRGMTAVQAFQELQKHD